MNAINEKLQVITMQKDGPTLAEQMGLTLQQARDMAERGCEFAADGMLEEAAGIFEGLLLMNPKDSANWAALGTVYQKAKQLADAEFAYERCLALDTDNVIALTNLGELKTRRGDKTGATMVQRAAAIDSKGDTGAGKRAKAMLLVSKMLGNRAKG